MNRRKFIHKSTTFSIGASMLGNSVFKNHLWNKDLIIGHNSHRYKVDLHWGTLNSTQYPVKDCHEMVMDSKGRIILLTNHVKNNILIYSKSGQLMDSWGTTFPGAHGLSIWKEDKQEVLFITDTELHKVFKTDLNGKILMELPYPKDSEKYPEESAYQPTETAIHSNGDIYVADGYGAQYILHYNYKGELLNVFGGRGNDDQHFQNAHGICIDYRTSTPTLLITARMQNKLKRFSLEGHWIENIDLPGAFICRPVIHNEHVYCATIWSGKGEANTGMISILNKENTLISAPGGNPPRFKENKLQHMYQTLNVFQHPHDVCVDNDENLYVAQWNSGNSYPIKLYRV